MIMNDKYYLYANSLKDEVKASILQYTGDNYIKINNYLEDNSTDNEYMIYDSEYLNNLIYDIDCAFSYAPKLDNDIILYRGLNMPVVKKMPLFGLKGLYKGYMSTSSDIRVSMMFSGSTNYILEIHVKKGQTPLFIELISDVPTEHEVLLPRNTILNITGFKKRKIKEQMEESESNILHIISCVVDTSKSPVIELELKPKDKNKKWRWPWSKKNN
jgi:hypothetical protein